MVVVPRDVRERLGVKVGDIIGFKVENDKVVLVPCLRGRAEDSNVQTGLGVK